MYAKVKANEVIKFPYTSLDFYADNPHTRYDSPVDIAALFPETEQATLHGCELVEVRQDPEPAHNPYTTRMALASSPVFVHDAWWLLWSAVPLSEQERDERRAGAEAAQWERIKQERDRRKASGVNVGGYWFHSDDPSRIQQLGLVMMGANVPAVPWKTMSGEFVTMSPTLARQIFMAVAAADQAIFGIAEQHKAAMRASEDPAAYDYLTGWPPVYGE